MEVGTKAKNEYPPQNRSYKNKQWPPLKSPNRSFGYLNIDAGAQVSDLGAQIIDLGIHILGLGNQIMDKWGDGP